MRGARSQAGFTFAEMMIVAAIFATLTGLFARAMTASSGLHSQSRLTLRVSEELRRDLQSVADRFRGAAVATLTGFTGGTSTDATFQCATGASGGVRTLDAAQEVKWQATTGTVNGVASPGQIVSIKGGVTTVLAARVPSGGFLLTQSGSSITIQLTAYYSTSDRKVTTMTDKISVTLRN